jgi:hypothetical protein
MPLLSASYRTEYDNLAAPGRHMTAWIETELDLQRLHRIFAWLWMAGRPTPPRSLHYQLLLGREVFVAERMDMHLVWTTGRIFLKPVPRFVLAPLFWTRYLRCEDGCRCSGAAEGRDAVGSPAEWRGSARSGFCFRMPLSSATRATSLSRRRSACCRGK